MLANHGVLRVQEGIDGISEAAYNAVLDACVERLPTPEGSQEQDELQWPIHPLDEPWRGQPCCFVHVPQEDFGLSLLPRSVASCA